MAADHPSTPGDPDPGLGETRAEELYDRYLEAALAGEMREPREFLEEAGVGEGPGVDELVGRLRQIQELVGQRERRAAGEGLPFDRLGEFRLLEPLGRGAMGVVYLAEQTSLGRLVALKVIREELAGTLNAEQRFEREARALARIQHPSVVRLYGFGTDRGARFLAMELVPGQSLADLISEGRPLPPVQVAQWGLELAGALARVHQAELLHRDVKPSNVRIHDEGYAVLVDFGLSRSRDLGSTERPGGFAGSLGFASPEQVRANVELGPQTDVYSLGATLYHALAGCPPFEADGIDALLQKILREDPPPLRQLRPQVPRDLATIVHHAMHKDPARRYASAHDLAADFEAVLALRPIHARPPGPVERVAKWARREPAAAAGLAVAVLAVLALLGLVGLQGHWQRVERVNRARAALDEARVAVAQYAHDRESMEALDFELQVLAVDRVHRFVTDAERAQYQALVDRVEDARRRRTGVPFVVGERLARALRLDPSLGDEATAIQRELLLEKWHDAVAAGDRTGMRLFEQELARADVDGEVDALLFPTADLTLTSTAPGSRAWLFRLVEFDTLRAGAPLRQVAVPVGADGRDRLPAAGAPALGEWVLRLGRNVEALPGDIESTDLITALDGHPVRGGGVFVDGPEDLGLEPGDRFVAVDGAAVWDGFDAQLAVQRSIEEQGGDDARCDVTVVRDGRLVDVVVASLDEIEFIAPREWLERHGGRVQRWRDGRLDVLDVPPGLPWRPTANPLYASPACELELGRPVRGLRRGVYVALVTAPGCEPVRVGFVQNSQLEQWAVGVEPRPVGFAPPGFVHSVTAVNGQREHWVCEHEVTVREYIEFLEDPDVRAVIDASLAEGHLQLLPRAGNATGIFFPRDAGTGQVTVPDSWNERMAVVGVSNLDARAYAEWRTARRGQGEFHLGDEGERNLIGLCYESRVYSWGTRFDPRFANTCFSRPIAGVEAVMSYPVDESPLGVYDLCGNAAEQIDDWFDEANGYRHAIGGAWGQAPETINRVLGGYGHRPDRTSGETGLRMLWLPEEAE